MEYTTLIFSVGSVDKNDSINEMHKKGYEVDKINIWTEPTYDPNNTAISQIEVMLHILFRKIPVPVIDYNVLEASRNISGEVEPKFYYNDMVKVLDTELVGVTGLQGRVTHRLRLNTGFVYTVYFDEFKVSHQLDEVQLVKGESEVLTDKDIEDIEELVIDDDPGPKKK